jgi:hypothetical protein
MARETAHGTDITHNKHNMLKLNGELLFFYERAHVHRIKRAIVQ